MRTLIALCWVICLTSITAQEDIFLSTLDGRLYRLNLENCDYDLLGQMPVSSTDISFHPNGNLYAIGSGGQLYQIDVAAGTSTLVHTISDGPNQFFTALTISAEGTFYASGLTGGLWRYDLVSDVDNYLGNVGYGAEGDLTFYEGELYMAATDDNIIAVNIQNPSASTVAVSGNVNGRIFGIVSYAASCDSISVYALTDNAATIYEVDFASGSLIDYCSIPLQVSGGASTFEFLGSNPVIIESISTSGFSCTDSIGSLSVQASGGVGALTYSIDGVDYQSSTDFDDLALGQYTIYVADEVGCIRTRVFNVGDGVLNLAPPQPTASSCGLANGALLIPLSGGLPPYEFWLNDTLFNEDGQFNNLPAGNYQIRVLDQLGCELTTQAIVEASSNVQLDTLVTIPASCQLANGRIELSISGGRPPYRYAINGGLTGPDGNLGNLESLSSGNYEIQVFDQDNCVLNLETSLSGSPGVALELLELTSPGCETATGEIRINATGGSGPLLLTRNNRPQNSLGPLTGLAAGTYDLRLVDSLGCFDTLSVSLPSGRCPIYFPSAFSPDFDGVNDYFTAYSSFNSGIEIVSFQIYDRWGGLLFDPASALINDPTLRWSGDRLGKPLSNGTYLYQLVARYADGGEAIFSGEVQLLR